MEVKKTLKNVYTTREVNGEAELKYTGTNK